MVYHNPVTQWFITTLSHNGLSQPCHTMVYHNPVTQWCITTLSHNDLSQPCHTMVYHNSVTQWFITTLSHNGVSQPCHKGIAHARLPIGRYMEEMKFSKVTVVDSDFGKINILLRRVSAFMKPTPYWFIKKTFVYCTYIGVIESVYTTHTLLSTYESMMSYSFIKHALIYVSGTWHLSCISQYPLCLFLYCLSCVTRHLTRNGHTRRICRVNKHVGCCNGYCNGYICP